jgi:hypothetical protein
MMSVFSIIFSYSPTAVMAFQRVFLVKEALALISTLEFPYKLLSSKAEMLFVATVNQLESLSPFQ